MSSLNRVLLIGHLGKDPEMRATDKGRHRATFTMATSERWRDAKGELTEHTDWHNIVAWGKTAELASQYLTKGRQACVEGRVQTRKYNDKEGQERTITEIVANNITFLGKRPAGEAIPWQGQREEAETG